MRGPEAEPLVDDGRGWSTREKHAGYAERLGGVTVDSLAAAVRAVRAEILW